MDLTRMIWNIGFCMDIFNFLTTVVLSETQKPPGSLPRALSDDNCASDGRRRNIISTARAACAVEEQKKNRTNWFCTPVDGNNRRPGCPTGQNNWCDYSSQIMWRFPTFDNDKLFAICLYFLQWWSPVSVWGFVIDSP